MIVQIRVIRGVPVTVYSRDGHNWSTSIADLPTLEAVEAKIEPESPYWDLPDEDPLDVEDMDGL